VVGRHRFVGAAMKYGGCLEKSVPTGLARQWAHEAADLAVKPLAGRRLGQPHRLSKPREAFDVVDRAARRCGTTDRRQPHHRKPG